MTCHDTACLRECIDATRGVRPRHKRGMLGAAGLQARDAVTTRSKEVAGVLVLPTCLRACLDGPFLAPSPNNDAVDV